jgi:uncharacterized protein (DUF2461 family)
MTFAGIPVEALDFYEGLENDNTKTYWTANKEVYETCVRAPLVALCEALEPEFGPSYLFRPYNDLRFAKGRSPYKEQQGATVGDHYLHVSAAGLFAATGYYQMAPDQVARSSRRSWRGCVTPTTRSEVTPSRRTRGGTRRITRGSICSGTRHWWSRPSSELRPGCTRPRRRNGWRWRGARWNR